ncbi:MULTISPECIES: methyltransferase domain-containing protein [Caulobacter]|jgi:trans-aconitate 2-methyltransferase|uniref:Trans-aconitate methyltransferase n=1 Tax=Caulobacter vibrioides OR37 TaxID=1292034 RepID=R0E817_CAUVI|nr:MULTISPECIES: methyltransferase domain-containing protein [Caulobacter]ENZ81628.1 trans-aconitate methyltransferase [Caulobacter vibrioides OR37]MBQ1562400.1 methyltransferase domain-containing protein [Caulobacter sp.]
MATWDPDVYALYRRYRERPALDLLTAIPGDLKPREIWDLGCGLGEQAALLAARHPEARVRGLDSSPEMLERAKRLSARVEWVLGDLAGFAPETPADLIFSNAALQWVDDHPVLIPRLVAALAEGGVLAAQMPVVDGLGWRASLAEIAASGPWAKRFSGIEGVRAAHDPADYYGWLAPSCPEIDIWTTTYLHALHGQDPIVDWTMGTTLRPYLDALPDDEKPAFLDAWRARLSRDYPRREDGVTLFPFKRLFILARKG